MTDEAMKSALTAAEWRECVEIARSGNDPLTYLILSDPHKAMCWINGNLPDHDPHKITRHDVDDLLTHAGGAAWRRDMTLAATISAVAAKLAPMLRPVDRP